MNMHYVDLLFAPSMNALRGCMTSGEQWIFFIYTSLSSEKGHVACSDEFSLGTHLEGLPLILGLLTDWVCATLFFFFFFSGIEGLTTITFLDG